MNATGKRRLLKLADFLATLPADKTFDMHTLASEIKDGRPACGSAACAIGWGAAIPSFRRAGYRLNRTGGLSIKGMRNRYWEDLAARFFSVSNADIVNVFGVFQKNMHGNPARIDAIKRIRKLVASEQKRAA